MTTLSTRPGLVSARLAPQPPDESQPARQAAAQAVSQLFFAPLLAELRSAPFGRKFAHGGRGEDIFGEQLDQRLADHVSRASGNNLTALLTRKLTPRGSAAMTQPLPATAAAAAAQAPAAQIAPANETASGLQVLA